MVNGKEALRTGGWSTAAPVPQFQTGQLVQTCLEMQNIRFHASTVQHSVRITQNLSEHVMQQMLRTVNSLLAIILTVIH
ncbi:hypothetical protein T11_17596 [Trichinella zimbabwensis]|uniref:Uncharacterized protein n=1 Tax=Trichinella zimbabwensis TaxID=268475 RepID=A0A0V1HT26_9BILA|nr:hypothetical protein T11_17596 [Trichinella zimbabwensis]